MKEFEELKYRISHLLKQNGGIPHEVINIVEKVFNQIEGIYRDNRCYNSSIAEGLNTELKFVKAIINGKIADSRSKEQYEEVMSVVNKLGRHIEDVEQDKNKVSKEELKEIEDRNNKQFYEQFLQVGANNRQTARRVMDLVMSSLKGINSKQNRILYNRGELRDNRIDDIQQQVLEVIRRFQDKDEEIYMLLEEDDRLLKEAILEQYQSHIERSKMSEQEKFKDSLDAGISLEEQHSLAMQFKEDSEKEQPKAKSEDLSQLFK